MTAGYDRHLVCAFVVGHTHLVTAIEWTLVGLMAASLGVLATAVFSRLARIDARIETLGAGISSRIDALLTETLDVPHDQHGSTSSDRKPSG